MKRIVFFGLVFLGFQAVFSQIPMEQNMTNLEKKQSSVLEEKLLKKLSKLEERYSEDIICIGHGLKFRAVLRYCKITSSDIRPEPKDFNPYRLINSMDEQIRNLDTLKIDLGHRTYKVIKRSENFNPETHNMIKQ